MNRISFTSANNSTHSRTIEKKVQKINTLATGMAGLGIVLAATGAAEIADYAKKDGSCLNKSVKRSNKILVNIKQALLKDKGIKYAADKASLLAEKSQKFAERIGRRLYKIPRTVRIASAIALGLLGINHVYRKGQINGAITTTNIAGQAYSRVIPKVYKKGFQDGEKYTKLNYLDTLVKKEQKNINQKST